MNRPQKLEFGQEYLNKTLGHKFLNQKYSISSHSIINTEDMERKVTLPFSHYYVNILI